MSRPVRGDPPLAPCPHTDGGAHDRVQPPPGRTGGVPGEFGGRGGRRAAHGSRWAAGLTRLLLLLVVTFSNVVHTVVSSSCPAGWYQNHEQASCNICPAGKYQNQLGQTLCNSCPVGTYQDQLGQTQFYSCKLCQKGRWSNQEGLSASGQCQQCSAGKYQNSKGMTECKHCPSGKWSNALFLTSDGQCKECPPGRWSNREGLSASDQCQQCSAGRYSDKRGRYADSQCKPCESGRWSAETGLANGSACKHCPSGRWSDEDARSNDTECTIACVLRYSPYCGYNRSSCPAGRYANSSTQRCEGCSAGKWSNKTGLTDDSQCQGRCPAGKGSTLMGLAADSSCETCPPGRYAHNGTLGCQGCSGGTWSNQTGLVADSQCKACSSDVGYTSATAASGLDDAGQCGVEVLHTSGCSSGKSANECPPGKPNRWLSNLDDDICTRLVNGNTAPWRVQCGRGPLSLEFTLGEKNGELPWSVNRVETWTGSTHVGFAGLNISVRTKANQAWTDSLYTSDAQWGISHTDGCYPGQAPSPAPDYKPGFWNKHQMNVGGTAPTDEVDKVRLTFTSGCCRAISLPSGKSALC